MKQNGVFICLSFILFITAGSAFAGIKEKLIRFAVSSSGGDQEFTVGSTLDSDSEDCLQCHNGAHASRIIAKSASSSLQIRDGRSAYHPIGMVYGQNQAQSPDKFVPPQILNPDIKLVDGRVGCRSCHALKSSGTSASPSMSSNIFMEDSDNCTASDQLTVWGNRTDLCLSCHIK